MAAGGTTRVTVEIVVVFATAPPTILPFGNAV